MECLSRTSTNCALKAKDKKTPAAAAGGPGGRAVDAFKGVVVKQERGMTVTKKMKRAIWQLRGNWGLARGRNKMMSFKSKLLICWIKRMMMLIYTSNLYPKN